MRKYLLFILAVTVVVPYYTANAGICSNNLVGEKFNHYLEYAHRSYYDETHGHLFFTTILCDEIRCPDMFVKYSLDGTVFYGCETLEGFETKYKDKDYTDHINTYKEYTSPPFGGWFFQKSYHIYNQLGNHIYFFGPFEKYKGKTVLSFGEANDGFIQVLNEKFGAKAYGVDNSYKSTDINNKKIKQDVVVTTQDFLKIKEIPDLKDGVDYIVGKSFLCCIIAHYDPAVVQPAWNRGKYEKYFNATNLKQAILNTIAVLKNGGNARFVWIEKHAEFDKNARHWSEKDVADYNAWYDSAIRQVIIEIRGTIDKVPTFKIEYYDGYSATNNRDIMLLKLCKIDPITQDCHLD